MTPPSPSGERSATRPAVRKQEVVADLGRRACETADVDEVASAAVEAVGETLDATAAAAFESVPDDGGFDRRRAIVRDEDRTWSDGNVRSSGTGALNRVALAADAAVVVADFAADDRFDRSPAFRDRAVESAVCARIDTCDGPWGVLCVYAAEPDAFDEVDGPFVRSVANVLGTAVDRDGMERRPAADPGSDTALEAAPVGITVVDADGEVRFGNERAAAILGRRVDRIEGSSVDAFEWDAVDSDERPLADEELPFARVVETGEPLFGQVVGLLDPDGERVWVSVAGAPLPDGDALDAVVFAFEDVTERVERRRTLERYETAVETAHEGIYVLDADRRFELVNESFADLTPYSREELRGEHASVVFGESFASIEAEHRDEVEGVRSRTFEETIIAGSEASRAVENRFVIYGDDGSEQRIGVVRDVTERNRMQAEIRERERQLRVLSEHLEEAVWLTEADPWTYVYANPAYEDVFGRDRDRLYDDGSSWLETVHPDDTDRVRAAYDALPDEPFEEEYRVVRPDGERRWIHSRAIPVTDDEGEVQHIVGIDADVTENRERERKLGKYRTILETIDDGVYTADDDDRFTLVNDAYTELTGYDRDELLGEHVSLVVDDDVIDQARELASVSEATQFESTLRTADGEEVPIETAVTAHGTKPGSRRRIGVVRDITEQQEYRRKLEASNERLEQFAYAASHDLQEPLRMVSSYLQLLENRYGDDLDEDGREFLDFAVDGADRMRNMIDGLLEYSRVDTQGAPFEPVDLDALLEEVLDDLRLRIEESDAEVTAALLPTVRGDSSQLRRLLQNLVSNAIEYSGDEPPRIHVDADVRGQRCVLSVRDEGIGIDPEDQARIFELFQRLHTREEHDGTGMGLTLARRIVERHGGDIWVESEPGEGTTFSLTLPLA